jgi:hypothetical protein
VQYVAANTHSIIVSAAIEISIQKVFLLRLLSPHEAQLVLKRGIQTVAVSIKEKLFLGWR